MIRLFVQRCQRDSIGLASHYGLWVTCNEFRLFGEASTRQVSATTNKVIT